MSSVTQVLVIRQVAARRRRVSGLAQAVVPPLLVGVIVVLSWEAIVRAAGVPAFILPAPSAILERFGADFALILSASRITALAVLGGIGLGAGAAFIAAFVVAMFERSSAVVLMVVSVISCAPIVALAPIFNAWFGATNLFSKIAVAAIMVFFPVMVNTTRGLLDVSPIHRELMESLGASRIQVLAFVRVPGALPSMIDGLKVGASLAVIGIIVAEYFGGTANALGVVIANSAAISQFTLSWAAVFAASALGILMYLGVLLVERLIIPWKQ